MVERCLTTFAEMVAESVARASSHVWRADFHVLGSPGKSSVRATEPSGMNPVAERSRDVVSSAPPSAPRAPTPQSPSLELLHARTRSWGSSLTSSRTDLVNPGAHWADLGSIRVDVGLFKTKELS